jgi:hypothetical protein
MPRIPPAAVLEPNISGTRSNSQPGLVECFWRSPKCRWRALGIVALLDAGTAEQFNKAFAQCHFLPQTEHRQFVRGVRFALWWHCRRSRGAGSLLGFAGVI